MPGVNGWARNGKGKRRQTRATETRVRGRSSTFRWGRSNRATHITHVLPISLTSAPAHLPRSPAGVTRATATIPEMFEQRRLSRVPSIPKSLSCVGRPFTHARCASRIARSKGAWSAETAPRRHPRGAMLAIARAIPLACIGSRLAQELSARLQTRLHSPGVRMLCRVACSVPKLGFLLPSSAS